MEQTGSVSLVGAGCGAADLITLRGLTLLRECDTVVYDDLIDPALLAFAPEGAERIYMGKRSGRHSATQAEICALLIQKAQQGKRVVRLKGGDPFVFGRGGEELLALRAAGVPCEEVPGITSAIAIPAAAGVPVTHRQLSRSVHIITAHTAGTGDGLPGDLERLAGLEGTLIFLMGLNQLPKIARRLIEGGKPPGTAAAVISGGNSPHHACVRGPLDKIAFLAQRAGVEPPAVIVVGGTAALELSPTLKRPLEGVQVGLTGTAAITDKLAGLLRRQGASAFPVQTAAVEDVPAELSALPGEGWLVFTSANGVDAFFRALNRQRLDIRRFARCRFAVIGPATGAALARHGIRADLCPETFTSTALGDALLQTAGPEEPLVLLRSAQAGPELRKSLRQAGRQVREHPVYSVRPVSGNREGRRALLERARYLIFSSAGGVRAFLEEFGPPPERAVCAAIGPVTAAALKCALPGRPLLMAKQAEAREAVQVILQHHIQQNREQR